MLKKFIPLIFILIFGKTGFAEETVYHLEVGDFSELQVIDGINVIQKCNTDSAGYAVFSAEPEVVRALMFTNNKGKLKIERNLDIPLIPEQFPIVTVYSNFLSSVENFSDSTVTVISPTPGASFKALVQGNGTVIVSDIHATQTSAKLETGKGCIILTGKTQSIKLNNVGTGIINASEITATEGTATIVGTGIIECNVSEELYIKGMGSGKVYVSGNPKIKKRSIGSIKIISNDETKASNQ